MAIKYPDILEHNNPNFPLVDITSLKGVAYPLGNLSETGSIPTAKRNPGTIVFLTSSQEFYGYKGQTQGDWDTTTNWEVLGSGQGSGFPFSGSAVITGSLVLEQGSILNNGVTTVNTSNSPYIIGSSEYLVKLDASSGTLNLSLPTSSINKGRQIHFKVTTIPSTPQDIIFTATGTDLIDGKIHYSGSLIDSQYEAISMMCDGEGNWWIF